MHRHLFRLQMNELKFFIWSFNQWVILNNCTITHETLQQHLVSCWQCETANSLAVSICLDFFLSTSNNVRSLFSRTQGAKRLATRDKSQIRRIQSWSGQASEITRTNLIRSLLSCFLSIGVYA